MAEEHNADRPVMKGEGRGGKAIRFPGTKLEKSMMTIITISGSASLPFSFSFHPRRKNFGEGEKYFVQSKREIAQFFETISATTAAHS